MQMLLRAIPLFVPGVGVSILVAIVGAGVLARALGTPRLLAAFLLVALGVVLAATLTPSPEALAFGHLGTGVCDLSRVTFAPWRELATINDVSLNVILFVPLGVAVGLLPESRSRGAVRLAAIALPFAIELTQLVVRPLDRSCQSGDVVDNLTGLVVGMVPAIVVGAALVRAQRRPLRP